MTIDTERLATDPRYWDECGAPEEATHYTSETDNNKAAWWIGAPKRNARKLCKLAGSDSDRWTEERADDDEVAATIPRPQKPEVEWDGEGLPPVGAELDYVIGDQRYPVTVVGHYDDEVVVFQHESAPDYVGVQPGYLKPQRTKRQRQRDELEDLIHSNLGPECNIEAAASAIIDAGWKKDV